MWRRTKVKETTKGNEMYLLMVSDPVMWWVGPSLRWPPCLLLCLLPLSPSEPVVLAANCLIMAVWVIQMCSPVSRAPIMNQWKVYFISASVCIAFLLYYFTELWSRLVEIVFHTCSLLPCTVWLLLSGAYIQIHWYICAQMCTHIQFVWRCG